MSVEKSIRLALPFTDDDELNEIRHVLDSGYLTQGPKTAEFERLVAEYVGTKYAFATTSATTALHLSLVVLGIGPGDEVLVPDFTFPATANVVVQQGAKPVLVDIDLDTFTMNVSDLESKITRHSKAIIPVHTFGLAADMDPIMKLAQIHRLAVIEDAACAIGTTYFGRQCGGIGTLGCFSFHPRKVITTGEGGMITTNDDALADKIQLLRSHGGIRRDGRFTFEAAGFNYRLSDILSAVGVAQMRKLNILIAHKRDLSMRLAQKLHGISGISLPQEPIWQGHIYQSFVVILDGGINRDEVIRRTKENGVETTLGTYALHAQPFFIKEYGYSLGDLKNSLRAYHQSLTLPLYPPMQESDIDRVVWALLHALEA
jgi:dTDP-4-amino-4,6-dideoxygalactose transaminase